MIEISVTGLQKSFDLEKKILDGLTFQINSGERVGLLGKNGAGKTTLFRILTGEIDYDAGEVAIASDRRVGLISQIPVYPAGYTVEDVLQSAFERMRRMADEMERLSAQMAKGDESEETLRRYGELSARFEGLGGYDTATAVRRLKDNASDKFLEVVTPTDIPALLRQIPQCQAIVTTGEKATDTLCQTFGATPPATGEYSEFHFEGRPMRLYRMPSSSRAYPLPLEQKAAAYRRLFTALNMV